MEFTLLDALALFVFFGGILAVSLWKSRGERDSAGYFLGDRSLTWGVIGLSIVAANISTEQMVGMAGNAAGGVGLAVSNWQLAGSVGIVLIAFTLLPRFLRAGIYTIPEYLEYRYNAAARALMAIASVLIYAVVLLPAVLYSGALLLEVLFGCPIPYGVAALVVLAGLFSVWGGLKAVAWADLFMGAGLLLGGALVFVLGLRACGGWDAFAAANATKLHMVLPADHPDLPWTGVVSGMGIVILYYCGLNQFIIQRNLAAKTLRDGQLGMILAGALWLLVPFIIVMPGLMAAQLYPAEVAAKPDAAFPTLLANVLPAGLRGLMLAAIAGAIVSSLASMVNSGATIFTLDVYQRWLDRGASQARLVWVGRGVTAVGLLVGGAIAPVLADPDLGGVFQFIQQFQGYIWPGVCAAFVVGMLVPKAPPAAGVAALVAGPVIYGLFQQYSTLNFLLQVALSFVLAAGLMGLITALAPLAQPKTLPARADVPRRTEPAVYGYGGAVLLGVALFYAEFW